MSARLPMCKSRCRTLAKHYPRLLLPVLCLSLSVIVFPGLYTPPSFASSKHDQLKIVYLLNILKFVKWPVEDDGQLSLCYIKSPEIQKNINILAGKSVKGTTLKVVEVTANQSIEKCHAVYFDDASAFDASQLILQARRYGVIDIGEGAEYTNAGGVIGFHIVDNKLRFNINLPEAQLRGVSLSANLVDLAYHVIK